MMVAATLQIVISVTPSLTLWNWGGSWVATSMPGGRGRLTSSSTVASTMPAPRSTPAIMFLPTLERSGSCPVLTGQRSTPGLSASGSGRAAILGAACGATAPKPAAILILFATSVLTMGSVLTSVTVPPSTGGVTGGSPGGTGGFGGGVPGSGTGVGPGCA